MSGWGHGAFGYAGDDGDSDAEDQEGFETKIATKDSLIFLIDTCQSMFDKPAAGSGDDDDEEPQSHFDLCMKVILLAGGISLNKNINIIVKCE